MANRIDNVRKITRVGKGSLAVILPASLVRALGWREKQRVLVKKVPRGIMIQDAKTKVRRKK